MGSYTQTEFVTVEAAAKFRTELGRDPGLPDEALALRAAVARWNDEEAGRGADARVGALKVYKGTDLESAQLANYHEVNSECAIAVPVYDRTKPERHREEWMPSPELLRGVTLPGGYSLRDRAAQMLERKLGQVVPSSMLKVTGMPKPDFSITRTPGSAHSSWEVVKRQHDGSVIVLDSASSRSLAVARAKELITAGGHGSELEIRRVPSVSQISVKLEQPETPPQLQLDVTLQVPTKAAKLLGWMVAFSYHY